MEKVTGTLVRISHQHPYPPAWGLVGRILPRDDNLPWMERVSTPSLAGEDTICWDGPTDWVYCETEDLEVA